jgi:hypothetical protein
MSKIALSPNASGTGVFTIASPSGNTDRTLTLPDEAGTVLTTASSIASTQLTGDAVPIGVGQTWTDVTASRANDTTYTNSTGKPIAVMVSSNMAQNVRMYTFIAGTQVADNGISTVYGGMGYTSFIVPNGVTYKITMVHGSIVYWWELR